MKKISLPTIALTKSDKIWMTALYEKIKKNERVTYKTLRAELFNQLPKDFHPNQIDSSLVRGNGQNITLAGIHAIAPNTDILAKANRVIQACRDYLIENPETPEIKAELIADLTKIPEADVALIFQVISPYGRFWRSASGNNEYYGLSAIEVDSDNEVFDQYLYFTSIEDLINQHYKDVKKQKTQKIASKTVEDLPTNDEKKGLYVNPIFTSRLTKTDYKLCFVLMPFKEEWSDRIYKSYIRENIELMGFQCLRADALTGPNIIEDIWIKINQAAFIIADVTKQNPNVMYELGIAHTVGKPIILITQNIQTIPFDFTHLRHYEYADNSDGKIQFSDELKRVLPKIYQESYPSIEMSFK